MSLAIWPVDLLACTTIERAFSHRCRQMTAEQCAIEHLNQWPIVILGRIKDAFIDPHPIDRVPALGGRTRWTYAEVETIEVIKGKTFTPYIARIAFGECGAYGPFKVGQVSLFALRDIPSEGPAVFRGHRQLKGGALMPAISYATAHQLPDRYQTEEFLELFREQVRK